MRGRLPQFDGVTGTRIGLLKTVDARDFYGMVKPVRNAGVGAHLPGPAQCRGDVFQCAAERRCRV